MIVLLQKNQWATCSVTEKVQCEEVWAVACKLWQWQRQQARCKLDFFGNPLLSIAMDYLERGGQTLSVVTWETD